MNPAHFLLTIPLLFLLGLYVRGRVYLSAAMRLPGQAWAALKEGWRTRD